MKKLFNTFLVESKTIKDFNDKIKKHIEDVEVNFKSDIDYKPLIYKDDEHNDCVLYTALIKIYVD